MQRYDKAARAVDDIPASARCDQKDGVFKSRKGFEPQDQICGPFLPQVFYSSVHSVSDLVHWSAGRSIFSFSTSVFSSKSAKVHIRSYIASHTQRYTTAYLLPLHANPRRDGRVYKPKVWLARPQNSGQVFRVVLDTHIPRMILQFESLHANARFILAYETKATCLQALDIVWIHLMPMPMAFVDPFLTAVGLPSPRFFASILEDRWMTAESPSATHGSVQSRA